MILDNVVVGNYMVNCYITGDSETKEVIIIDPGFDGESIKKAIDKNGYKPKAVVLTHGHGDHIGAVSELMDTYGIPLYIHKFELDMISETKSNFSKMIFGKTIILTADKHLSEGDIIKVGNIEYEVIHTPGHTPGGICLKSGDALFTGDTLFQGSIGRTDFPGGSYEQIINSIKTKLLKYNDETKVYPGHNGFSSIGYEKKYNPFLK
jgi:glyoxylase-like metal-dependent hydrolase (beta-lactamase superfamily II)